MASITVSTVAGPVEQLTPIASAPHSVSSAAACCGDEPSRQLPSSSTVTITSTGKSGAASSAASIASRASFSAVIVSMISRSTPAVGKRSNLLRKGRPRLLEPSLAQRLQPHAQRPDRARHPGLAGLFLLQVRNRLLGELHTGGVDFGNFGAQSVAREPESVGAERIGLENLGTGLKVLFMHSQNHARDPTDSTRRKQRLMKTPRE